MVQQLGEAEMKRRRSARIKNIKPELQKSDNKPTGSRGMGPVKKAKLSHSRPSEVEAGDAETSVTPLVKKPVLDHNRPSEMEEADVSCENKVSVDTNAHAKVTEVLRNFNKHYLHFVQEEEKRCAREEADLKDKKVKSKGTIASNEKRARPHKRPDLKAITEMLNSNTTIFSEKRIGNIPGIDVGHQFFSRAEMVVVGFHQHWLNGIDYIGKTAKKRMVSMDYKLPVAVSIVLSGQYEDDLDNFDEIVYTGQGGNNLLGNKRQISNQVMQRGNLGLKNCMEQSLPVRVIRGHKCQNSYVGKVYTYDGLYKVVKYWAEQGLSGFTVFKFRLKRLEGQPPLTTDQVYFSGGRVPKSISELRGLVCEDLSGGLENIPIPVTNLVDVPPVAPADCTYTRTMLVRKNVSSPAVAHIGCDCLGECKDPRTCSCAKLNGGDFPYVHRDGGRLVEPRAVVFECGPSCGCGPKCINRTSQKGLMHRLEVFRTPNKGWGVRSWDYIPSGSPICEYIGLLKRADEIDPAADDTYVFQIDCLQTMKGMDGRESRFGKVKLPPHLLKVNAEVSKDATFCIDAGITGNVARYINHSCQPNLFVQCILSNHHDARLARIVLIAADNIPPLKELTYDYGYEVDSVLGVDGKIRVMPCTCGAEGCRKRLY